MRQSSPQDTANHVETVDVIAGVTAVKGRDAAVKAMTFLLKGLRIPK